MKYVETAAIATTLLIGSWAVAQPEGVAPAHSAQTFFAIGGCSTEPIAGSFRKRRDTDAAGPGERL